MISSDLPEVLGMSDRVAVMRGGRLVAWEEGATTDAARIMAAALGQNSKEVA
jgi:ABC-type sugar transport system ATPase subunit